MRATLVRFKLVAADLALAVKEPLARKFIENLQLDETCNVSPTILAKVGRRLHLAEASRNHPLSLINQKLHQIFLNQNANYKFYDSKFANPVVSTKANFDDLLIPGDHPSRNKSDTYYFNRHTLLRTHTSAHQSAIFSAKETDSFLLTADVYRRDEINASHYPVFHQVEGASLFDFNNAETQAAQKWMDAYSADEMLDLSLPSNPIQDAHRPYFTSVKAVARHLQASLNDMAQNLFPKKSKQEKLPIRWVEAYFPFTSPSWELEIWYNDQWLEVAGCGIIRQDILKHAGIDNKLGWAFGLGLERLAMVLFDIPDIRLFWSQDERFLRQFAENGMSTKFKPYSKHPGCYKDVSFWLPPSGLQLHENDVADMVRVVAGDMVEDVKLLDSFYNPKLGKTSQCYRINYRSMDRNLSNDEVNKWQSILLKNLVQQFNIELR